MLYGVIKNCKIGFLAVGPIRDVAAAPQTPNWGGGAGQLWGPKIV